MTTLLMIFLFIKYWAIWAQYGFINSKRYFNKQIEITVSVLFISAVYQFFTYTDYKSFLPFLIIVGFLLIDVAIGIISVHVEWFKTKSKMMWSAGLLLYIILTLAFICLV